MFGFRVVIYQYIANNIDDGRTSTMFNRTIVLSFERFRNPGQEFSYDPVTQKVCVHMKGDTTFMLYGDIPDI